MSRKLPEFASTCDRYPVDKLQEDYQDMFEKMSGYFGSDKALPVSSVVARPLEKEGDTCSYNFVTRGIVVLPEQLGSKILSSELPTMNRALLAHEMGHAYLHSKDPWWSRLIGITSFNKSVHESFASMIFYLDLNDWQDLAMARFIARYVLLNEEQFFAPERLVEIPTVATQLSDAGFIYYHIINHGVDEAVRMLQAIPRNSGLEIVPPIAIGRKWREKFSARYLKQYNTTLEDRSDEIRNWYRNRVDFESSVC